MRIASATLADLPGAYRTCRLAGDAGEDATGHYRDPDLLGHLYVGPYLVHGRGTQLVVVDAAGVAGYLASTDDTAAFESWAAQSWWPRLRARYPRLEDGSRDAELIELIHRPEITPPELARPYPAHFHIDLQRRARGAGLGRALVERLLDELRSRGIAGVHLGVDTDNPNAIGFYRHLGFHEVGTEPGGILMGLRLRERPSGE